MTSTLRFNLGDVRLRDEERRQLQKLSRELIELKANHYRVTESRLTPARIVAMRKIDWGGAGQIPEALHLRTLRPHSAGHIGIKSKSHP
jgi:hypothetical protein